MSAKDAKQKQGNKMLAVCALALAGVLVAGSVASYAAEFKDYTPPCRFDIDWYEWITESGSPADGSKPTHKPTWVQEYPYRLVLFGGAPASSSQQKHDSRVFVIFSKVPEIDLFTFAYRSGTKARYQYGYIRGRFDKADPLLQSKPQETPDVRIMYHGWNGVTDGAVSLGIWNVVNYVTAYGNAYIDFDFYYKCCGNLKIKGLTEIMDVSYPYIKTCTDRDGNGGSSERPSKPEPSGSSSGGSSSGGESSGGSSSGGSSSGGESPGESSGGSSSGGESSGGSSSDPGGEWSEPDPLETSSRPWESSNPGRYPWEQDRNTPDFSVSIPETPYQNGGQDGNGERGDGWTLPGYDGGGPQFGTGDITLPSIPGLDGMSPNYPIFEGPDVDAWGWPPDVQPGNIDGFPSKPSWMT